MKKVIVSINNRKRLGLLLANNSVVYLKENYIVNPGDNQSLVILNNTDNIAITEVDYPNETIKDIRKSYSSRIKELESKLIDITHEDKQELFDRNYEKTMEEIVTNCKRLAESKDKTEQWNRLKTIMHLKKRLFSGEYLTNLAEKVHRQNGHTKYEIKRLQEQMEEDIKALDDTWTTLFEV